jgi:hypothetical protein
LANSIKQNIQQSAKRKDRERGLESKPKQLIMPIEKQKRVKEQIMFQGPISRKKHIRTKKG